MAGEWCILRCAGRVTLRLAQTLGEDGFEVWTPRETRRIRIPRANVRREATLALLPSYVFARTSHLIDLLELAAMPVKPRRGYNFDKPAHPGFRVMKSERGIPVVGDRDLDALRFLEARRTPIRKAIRTFPAGVRVRVEGGSFGGMSGRVERSDEMHTLVCFSDKYVVKIPTSILREEELQNPRLGNGTAARKAA